MRMVVFFDPFSSWAHPWATAVVLFFCPGKEPPFFARRIYWQPRNRHKHEDLEKVFNVQGTILAHDATAGKRCHSQEYNVGDTGKVRSATKKEPLGLGASPFRTKTLASKAGHTHTHY